jgi:hypothetical protein
LGAIPLKWKQAALK